MANVMLIPARPKAGNNVTNTEKPKLRVAAYCRVSTDSDEQATSYEAQIEHYTEFIQKNSEWTLVGIYADDGITGTNTKKREEFNRMIADCESGNIDMVITKSISRFARNTLDCLKYIRLLKEKNIPVLRILLWKERVFFCWIAHDYRNCIPCARLCTVYSLRRFRIF